MRAVEFLTLCGLLNNKNKYNMKNKKLKLIGVIVGLLLTGLWIWDLFEFSSLTQIVYVIKVGYFGFGWILCILFLLAPTGIYDNEEDNKEYGRHFCDFCGKKMKIAEGKHWPNKDGCICACDICLPTVDTKNL
jgi:hypothetical protein